MTSNINYLSINENFPVAGQDNDTQVFRDNFDTIKTNFRYAKEDIESLQNNTGGLNCTENGSGTGSDFGKRTVENALLIKTAYQFQDKGIVSAATIDIDWEGGSYQKFVISSDKNMSFSNFAEPDDDVTNKRAGNAIIELECDSVDRTITFLSTESTTIRKSGFPSTVSGDLVLTSDDQGPIPVLIEVWQHTVGGDVLIKYIGSFE